MILPRNYAASYAHAPATLVALQAPLLYSKSVQQYEQKIITDKATKTLRWILKHNKPDEKDKTMRTWYEYMIDASKDCGHDGDLWLRYLYKVIQDGDTKLTDNDVAQLLASPVLTQFQKVSLQDALTEGTHMREHILRANRKFQPKDIITDKNKGD